MTGLSRYSNTMSTPLHQRLHAELARREAAGTRRRLPAPPAPGLVDFSSNDYLGLSRHPQVRAAVAGRAQLPAGSTGSACSPATPPPPKPWKPSWPASTALKRPCSSTPATPPTWASSAPCPARRHDSLRRGQPRLGERGHPGQLRHRLELPPQRFGRPGAQAEPGHRRRVRGRGSPVLHGRGPGPAARHWPPSAGPKGCIW